jgi:phosphoglycerate kinase
MALDVGTKTIADFQKQLTGAKTIFWNGPAGVFEFDHFQHGTKAICEILKKLTKNGSYTLIGGGDSAAAALNLGFKESDFSFISTGGGASLEYIEGKDLPGVSSIQKR